MNNCVIIPARYNSKRLPGKPLIQLNENPLIGETIKYLKKKIDIKDIFVCTDSLKVAKYLKGIISNPAIIIKKKCLNGTERCSWALEKIKKNYDYVTIVSCDMPLVDSKIIKYLEKKAFDNKNIADGYTVHVKITDKKVLSNSNVAKIVTSKSNRVLYLSRNRIPSLDKFVSGKFFSHHGIVMLKKEVLKKYKYLKNTNLQIMEDNEWLKLIENDYLIKSYPTKEMHPEINTKKDLNDFFKIKKIYNFKKYSI